MKTKQKIQKRNKIIFLATERRDTLAAMIVMLGPLMTAAPAPMDDTTPMMTDTTAMIDTAADQTITTTTMTDMETEST